MNFQNGMIPPQYGGGNNPYSQPPYAMPPDMQGMQQNSMHMAPPMNAPEMGQMGESEYRHVSSVLGGQPGNAVTSTAFDSVEELLWVGTRAGYVSSYYGPNLQKYTAFRVHSSNPVIQLMPSHQGIFTLTQENVRCYARFGRCTADFMSEGFHNMQCMLHTVNNSILVGGHQQSVFELDIDRLALIKKYQIEDPGVAIMKSNNRFTIFGDTSGQITIRDPQTLKIENQFQAHSFTLSDFDAYENQIVTCGFSNVAPMRGGNQIDRFLMVYDVRMMRIVSTIQCAIEPYYLKFVPSYTSRVFVVAHSGQYQIIDTTGAMMSAPLLSHPIQAATGPISAFDVSSSHQSVSFGDEAGCCHLYSNAPNVEGSHAAFNPYSQETQFADVTERLPHMNIDDPMANYASVPMPYPGQGSLFSDWPPAYTQRVYRAPAPIDPAILNNVKMTGNLGYGKMPEGVARPFPYQLKSEPGYRGGKQRGGGTHSTRGGRSKSHIPASPIGREEDPFLSVPKQYRKVEIKYSKLGVEDFDFRHYNKTHFAGLETHIPNAYCNSMLQVLYFIEPLRATLLNHLCQQEFCLACELGFLFHMLDVSKGMTCQASNFLRAFRTIPEASALGLNLGDDDEASKKNLARIIQNWSRFVMQQIHTEIGRNPKDSTPSSETSANVQTVVQKLFGTSTATNLSCSKCGHLSSRESETFMFNMDYPEAPVDVPHFAFSKVPFSEVIARSMNAAQSQQSFCQKCDGYQLHTQQRLLKNVPDVIGLNCQVDNDTTLDFWKRQLELLAEEHERKPTSNASSVDHSRTKKACRYGSGCTRNDCYFFHEGRDEVGALGGHASKGDPPAWVPLGLSVKLLDNGHVSVSNIDDPYGPKSSGSEDGAVTYELMASVAHIRDNKLGNNLVSHIHVGETYHQRKEGVTTTQFYLFNDFSIVDIEKEDAVKFNMDWKWPCALFYIRKNYNDAYKIEVKSPFENYESLFSEAVLASDRVRSFTNIPLSGDEKLEAGDVIGIDAEFVSLNQEESELRSDGTRSTIKPPQMSVARVTCIRGKGEKLDTDLLFKPFMDDYISTQEEVVDYLTQFSGIKPGDLDVALSSKHLTTLKSMYIRLRYMVDKGVIFVGHGLKKDFRVINIVIPPKQVCDTAELFYLQRQRRISLKFLAWYFLGETIQSDTHDSTEDAQAALKLYFKYKELNVDKKAKIEVIDLYEKGRELNWKVPEDAPSGVPGIKFVQSGSDVGGAGDT